MLVAPSRTPPFRSGKACREEFRGRSLAKKAHLPGVVRMATFYLLPSRPLLGEQVARLLERVLPGWQSSPGGWSVLAESLTESLRTGADVHFVFREDLPPGEDVAQALQDGFGAEPEDDIIQVSENALP
jgi:hypothetical protein